MTAVSEQWTWRKAACELAGAACRAQAGSRPRGSETGRRLASTGEHQGTGSPKSHFHPPVKAEGWDAGRE